MMLLADEDGTASPMTSLVDLLLLELFFTFPCKPDGFLESDDRPDLNTSDRSAEGFVAANSPKIWKERSAPITGRSDCESGLIRLVKRSLGMQWARPGWGPAGPLMGSVGENQPIIHCISYSQSRRGSLSFAGIRAKSVGEEIP
ncbi:hypothetical protein SAY86_008492 [Trapa natans]|uniref:Uncharacterized protein n=1 Tax=Trapa natans TaxID=22666 RepID=A0AAN7QB83_TRANT|nr:hypothetical protein SAY86_008492 [Trapa natans]